MPRPGRCARVTRCVSSCDWLRLIVSSDHFRFTDNSLTVPNTSCQRHDSADKRYLNPCGSPYSWRNGARLSVSIATAMGGGLEMRQEDRQAMSSSNKACPSISYAGNWDSKPVLPRVGDVEPFGQVRRLIDGSTACRILQFQADRGILEAFQRVDVKMVAGPRRKCRISAARGVSKACFETFDEWAGPRTAENGMDQTP